ncbi:MAG: hypothetical protein EOO06_10375 [Chitinophagaceae bacterium]|nr:MAG: hypothetical protein EOO06_10375 [Chitinophagaceae bacterium]
MQDCLPPAVPDSFSFVRGWKQYELSNHLGNVLATVSDRHFGVDTNSNSVTDYYLAEVITEQDYYPFGMHPSTSSG